MNAPGMSTEAAVKSASAQSAMPDAWARLLMAVSAAVIVAACGGSSGQPSGSGGGAGGGSAGGSGGGSAALSVNGCTTFADHTASTDPRAITFTYPSYTPPCMHISAGQTVTFSGDFSDHPLTPGVAPSSTGTSSAGNPITVTNSGSTMSFTFPATGTYAYYCANHQANGMYGAIEVE